MNEKCPDCGRPKARNIHDVLDECCPKWWAIRDPDAAADCDAFQTKLGDTITLLRMLHEAVDYTWGDIPPDVQELMARVETFLNS